MPGVESIKHFIADIDKRLLIILPIIFVIYAYSFNSYPAIEKTKAVYAVVLPGNYNILIRDFDITRHYGDEYNLVHRTLADSAQKHKIHHILFLLVASSCYSFFSTVYHWLGIDEAKAVYAVSSFIMCINIFLFYFLLKIFTKDKNKNLIFTLIYAFSLTTWLFGAVPDSWALSATILLLFLNIYFRYGARKILLSIYIGITMINNLFLFSLVLFPVVDTICRTKKKIEWIKQAFICSIVSLSTWLVAMCGLSYFDKGFRPDNFYKYTIWFKQHFTGKTDFKDLYFWKVGGTQLYINSFVSNQSDPAVPNEALLLTLKQSMFGAFAIIFLIAVYLLISGRIIQYYRKCNISNDINELTIKITGIILFCLAWYFLTMKMYPPAGILYANVVVPLITILFCVFSRFDKIYEKMFFYSFLAVIVINNFMEVVKFRDALSKLSAIL